MMITFAQGLDTTPTGQAIDALRAHTPGEHFLGTEHTLANFETAFYRSSLADNSSFEQWQEDGSLTAAQRANTAWKKSLASYEAPPIDSAVDEEMLDFIGRRKAEMPDELG
jgi:trimethylamine--corrinoid protein Co-methyltransferase